MGYQRLVTSSFSWIKQHLPSVDQWVLLGIMLFSWWLMNSTFQIKDSVMLMASKVWSDFGAHLPLIRSFSMGANFPPEYPQFPGEPIRYHYLFYALVGGLEWLGVRLDVAMNGLSALGMGWLLWMVYTYAKHLARSTGAGLVAISLVVLNGSLSWWYFTQKFLATHQHLAWWQWGWAWWQAVITQEHFATFGPWDGGVVSAFWTLNVFTNQRHLALSYALALWLVWPMVRVVVLRHVVKVSKWLGVAMVLGFGCFPLLHQAGAVVAVGSVVGLLVWDKLSTLQRAGKLLMVYGLGIGLAVFALTSLVPTHASQLLVKLFFLAQAPTVAAVWWYWWNNLGLYVPLLGFLLWWRPLRSQVLVWLALGLLVIANVWQLSPDMINNHKLVSFALLFLAIAVAEWLVKFWRWSSLGRWRGLMKPLLVTVYIGLLLGGIVDFFPISNDRELAYQDWPKQPAAIWLKTYSPPNSVVLTSEFFYHPASLVGRKIFVDYGYFAWSLGYQDQARRKVMQALFGDFTTTQEWCAMLKANHIDYVMVSNNTTTVDGVVQLSESFLFKQVQPTVQTADGYKIYAVLDTCQK